MEKSAYTAKAQGASTATTVSTQKDSSTATTVSAKNLT